MKATVEYRVPYADTDQMGVVYYGNYYVYFERLRTEILRNMNLPYSKLEAEGIFLPVIESHCEYKNSCTYDDLITIEGEVDYIKGVKVKINCRVYKDSELLVSGYTVHACINQAGKPIKAKNIFENV
ncbi:thioesterase family protein [Lentisphaerota bacterium WC36G]|nr:acyl-CoA thioesterase [Lentisphaerae bacterium WC36]